MYLVLVSPLSHVMVPEDENLAVGQEFIQAVQASLSQEVGAPVSWDEKGEISDSLEADDLNPYCWHGLRVAALCLEQEGSLEGFDPGEEPWDHPVFEQAEQAGGSEKFPQVVHGEAELVAYAPVELDDCYRLVPTREPDEEDGDEESGEGDVAVGSLPALRRELATLGKALGLPDSPEISDDLLPADGDDPLAEARLGCAVMAVRAAEAAEQGVPLIITWDDSEDGK